MNQDYRLRFYERYVSAFKDRSGKNGFLFTDSKLLPILAPWTRSIDRSARCVDLGCGCGNVLHALRTLGFEDLSGVDASAEQIELARPICPKAEVGLLAPYLQRFPDQHFGLITIFDVVEHLRKEELLDLIALVALKLAHGGTLIVHTPNGDSPFCGRVQFGDYTHETILNEMSARQLCELFDLKHFEAKEHLGSSRSWKGMMRLALWAILRRTLIAWDFVETGSGGSKICTRNFAFKATRP